MNAMTSVAKHKNSALRLLRRALLILTLLCLPTIGEAQKTRILPPKRPNKPAVKPKPKPAPKPNPKPAPEPKPEPPKQPTASEPTGYINGYGYVDLGLPSGTKWATCNVGASSPGDYGDYFAWGEISTKSTYDEKSSATYKKNGIGDISGNPSMDAARANWGSTWRIPTKTELAELDSKCTWTKQDGHNGYKVTGPNGRSIFLPASGWHHVSCIFCQGYSGIYWSSSPYGSDGAYCLCFHSDSQCQRVDWVNRYWGCAVRPVSE